MKGGIKKQVRVLFLNFLFSRHPPAIEFIVDITATVEEVETLSALLQRQNIP